MPGLEQEPLHQVHTTFPSCGEVTQLVAWGPTAHPPTLL